MNIDSTEPGIGESVGPEIRERISSEAGAKTSRPAWLAPVLATVAFFTLVCLWQWVVHAPQAAFDAYPDEPAHYVSGLLIRDYLIEGFPNSPLRFAGEYYSRIPAFAIGYWPPVFYAVEGGWMLAFGSSRGAVLGLIGCVAALAAALIFASTRPLIGAFGALGLGFLFLMSPIVRWSSGAVMVDLPVTLLAFAAALAYSRYLDTEKTRWSIAFAVIASLTILTKSNGAFLGLLPPLAILLTRKWRLLRSLSFWIAPFVVVLLCAPWFLATKAFVSKGFEGLERRAFPVALRQLSGGVLRNLTWTLPFSFFGAWTVLHGFRPLSGLAAVCIAQPVALAVLLLAAPQEIEPRYLTPLLPAMLVLVAYGIRDIAARFPARRPLAIQAMVGALVVATGVMTASQFRPVSSNPFQSFAGLIASERFGSVLVPADAEGALIAEICSRGDHRHAFLIRPGKLMSYQTWNGTGYRSRYNTTEEVRTLFERMPVDLIVARMDTYPRMPRHAALLRDMLLASPDRWHPVSSVSTASGKQYSAYRAINSAPFSPAALKREVGHPLDQFHRSKK